MRQHSCIFRLHSFDTRAYSQGNLSKQRVNEAAKRIFHTNSHFKPTSNTTCQHKEKMKQPSCIFKIHMIPTFKTVSIDKRVQQHHYKCIQSSKIRLSATLDILYQNPHTLTKCLLYSVKGRTVSHKSSVETKTAESIFCWKQSTDWTGHVAQAIHRRPTNLMMRKRTNALCKLSTECKPRMGLWKEISHTCHWSRTSRFTDSIAWRAIRLPFDQQESAVVEWITSRSHEK